jgi:hypothetical protein
MAVVDWTSGFEGTPAGVDSPGYGDDKIREFKENIRSRFSKEHTMLLSSLAADGFHRQGSALPYFTNTTPTALPDGTALATDARSLGRLFIKASSRNLLAWVGGSFGGILRELTRVSIQGTLAIGKNIVPPICFPRTATIMRIIARCATVPGTTGNPVYINVIKRAGSSTVVSTSLFTSAANRLTLSTGRYWSLRTTGQMSAGRVEIHPMSWLAIDLDAVGGTTKGANLAIEIEALLK